MNSNLNFRQTNRGHCHTAAEEASRPHSKKRLGPRLLVPPLDQQVFQASRETQQQPAAGQPQQDQREIAQIYASDKQLILS